MRTRILLLLFAFTSCSKDNYNSTQDILPPISTIGANTAGCIINVFIYDFKFMCSKILFVLSLKSSSLSFLLLKFLTADMIVV